MHRFDAPPQGAHIRGASRCLLVLAVAVLACGEPTAPDPVATTIRLSATSLSFSAKGSTAPLSGTVLDQSGTPMSAPALTWSSDDPGVATVSSQGVVTAIANGSTSVVAAVGGATGRLPVTVEQVTTSVAVTGERLLLTFLGDATTLSADPLDSGGSSVDGAAVAWSSSDASIASVDDTGAVTGHAVGTATISATSGGATGEETVTVEQQPSEIDASPDSVSLTPGDTATVAAVVRDAGGAEIPGSAPLWDSGDPSVATVSADGLVTAHVAGVTIVLVRAEWAGVAVVDSVPLVVFEDLEVSTATLPSGVEGIPYPATTLGATGGDGTYLWSLAAGSDPMPAGLTLSTDGSVSGTPMAVGASGLVVQVTSGDGQTAERALSIAVQPALSVSTDALGGGVVGVEYGPVSLTATGGAAPYLWSLAPTSPQLPDWLSLSPGGVLSGTPDATGSTSLVVRVSSADGQVADRGLTLEVWEPLSITTDALPEGAEGVAYGPVSLEATGGDGALAWALAAGSPALPDGLSLSGAGEITGTPTAPAAPEVVVEVASGDGQTDQRALTVRVLGPPAALGIAVQPSANAGTGAVFARQPVIQVRDAAGNDRSVAGLSVTAALASGGGALAGTTAVVTDADGRATFTDLSITGDGPHTLEFSSGALTPVTSDPISVSSGPTVLTDGVPLTGLSATAGEETLYVFTVPAGAPQLEVVMTGGTGDADLYVREGALPTQADYDCRPYAGDANETCAFPSPAQGDWFVMIHAFTDYSSVTLTASITSGCTLNSPGDADGDRLPDCVETNTGVFVSELDTGTDPANPDTDGDAIDDGDEVLGTEAGLDLPAFGVSPVIPTVLIEYDWFDDSGHSHRPTPTQIDMVTASFAAQGIQIIHDYGQGPAPFTGGNFIDDPDGNVDGFGPEYYGYKAANFAANRDGYFHYNLHPHRYNGGTSSGLAEINGDDLITATLSFYGSNLAVAGTIQHELGHNLGLRHGGDVNTNRKPNYNSVMSYNYQFGGVDDDCTPVGDGVLDYSHGTNPSLDENDLDESAGICGGAPGWDWNEDGDAVDTGVVADINHAWTSPGRPGDGTFEVLHDHDDWGNLNFAGILDGDGAGLRAPPEVMICPSPPPELLARE